jgi:hypothetical protein
MEVVTEQDILLEVAKTMTKEQLINVRHQVSQRQAGKAKLILN